MKSNGKYCVRSPPASLPVRGAWIEMRIVQSALLATISRSPCGERGLKYGKGHCDFDGLTSLPVRGAWIEMRYAAIEPFVPRGRSPCGERGLKFCVLLVIIWVRTCRSPCGERGLKSAECSHQYQRQMSLPVRGAWIEIGDNTLQMPDSQVAPRAGSVD